MDYQSRKGGRVTMAAPDFNLRTCTPAFYSSGPASAKQFCTIPSKPMHLQETLFQPSHMFTMEHRPQEASSSNLQEGPHQDIEFVTFPVYKARKHPEDVPVYPQDSSAILDLRPVHNLFSAGGEQQGPPYSYYYHLAQPLRPMEPCNIVPYQPPPRSPRRESTTRALVSQYAPLQHCKNEEPLFFHKNVLMGRKCTSDVQLPLPFQWFDATQKPKTCQGTMMRTIPERVECFPPGYSHHPDQSSFAFNREGANRTCNNELYTSTPVRGKSTRLAHRCARSRDTGTSTCLPSLNLSTTSQSSGSYTCFSSQPGCTRQPCKSCSDESHHTPSTQCRPSVYSVASQTDFLKSPLEEKFLFRETILFGCDEICKWARKCSGLVDVFNLSEYIRDKTKQSRAQNICRALRSDIDQDTIISEYLKVFLKVADCWLEARNCFGLCWSRKACELSSPDVSESYIAWQHASRRLLGSIIHGAVNSLATARREESVRGSFDCRITQSASNLQQMPERCRRRKWTVTDTTPSSSCSPCKPVGEVYMAGQSRKIADIPQHKITLLSQIEPPCLRNQESVNSAVDLSAWFRNGDSYNRMEDGSSLMLTLPQQHKQSGHQAQPLKLVYDPNDSSQESSEVLQKVYIEPGSYNVPKKKLTVDEKKSNVSKAKESCCCDKDMPRGQLVPFTNARPFVPPPSRGLQNPNIKIIKKGTELGGELTLQPECKWKEAKADDKEEHKADCTKTTPKVMKTDEWILSTLKNSLKLDTGEGGELEAGSAGKGQSQESSDHSDNTNSSRTPRLVSKTNKMASKGVWHNSKRRRVLSQRSSSKIDSILGQLWDFDAPVYIRQAVKANQIPDYYKLVKNPIFLETIINKSKSKVYETVEQWVHDCRRLVHNSLLCFEKNDAEVEKIEKFSAYLEKLLQGNYECWDYWNYISGDAKEVSIYPELRYAQKHKSKTPKTVHRKEDLLQQFNKNA